MTSAPVPHTMGGLQEGPGGAQPAVDMQQISASLCLGKYTACSSHCPPPLSPSFLYPLSPLPPSPAPHPPTHPNHTPSPGLRESSTRPISCPFPPFFPPSLFFVVACRCCTSCCCRCCSAVKLWSNMLGIFISADRRLLLSVSSSRNDCRGWGRKGSLKAARHLTAEDCRDGSLDSN